jgi:ribonucleotide reductase alpha subunit
MAEKIVTAGGTIQGIYEIPEKYRDKYKTAFEVSQKERITMINRAFPYIDQSTSLNLYYPDGDFTKMSSALIYGWTIGNKTGSYYTRIKKKDAETTADLFKRKEVIAPSKPDDSEFDCFGCSA